MPNRLDLSGECNRCGLCCTVVHEGQTLVCEHLRAEIGVDYKAKPLGTPGAARCGVYASRQDGMPIRMLNGRNEPVLMGVCCKDSYQEDLRVLVRGIGRGCSLTLDRATVPALIEYGTGEDGRMTRTVNAPETAFIRTGG